MLSSSREPSQGSKTAEHLLPEAQEMKDYIDLKLNQQALFTIKPEHINWLKSIGQSDDELQALNLEQPTAFFLNPKRFFFEDETPVFDRKQLAYDRANHAVVFSAPGQDTIRIPLNVFVAGLKNAETQKQIFAISSLTREDVATVDNVVRYLEQQT